MNRIQPKHVDKHYVSICTCVKEWLVFSAFMHCVNVLLSSHMEHSPVHGVIESLHLHFSPKYFISLKIRPNFCQICKVDILRMNIHFSHFQLWCVIVKCSDFYLISNLSQSKIYLSCSTIEKCFRMLRFDSTVRPQFSQQKVVFSISCN